MANVYRLKKDGSSVPLDRIQCRNETVELQDLLDRNYDLLPGDQINPDDPCRWLLIKREMPVLDRWSVDFFFVDQDATPTFVECKRSADTDARRKVVGQMLDYAANGYRYWTRDDLRSCAEATAASKGTTLDDVLARLRPTSGLTPELFFEQVEANLIKGEIRVVFFLEESSFELQSVVEFLNKQMSLSEVLLVEARQYRYGEERIVVPTLFGFTEQARIAKRAAATAKSGARQKWDEEMFFDHASSVLNDRAMALKEVLLSARALGCEVTWGTGTKTGSFNLKVPAIGSASLLSVYSDGRMMFNFGWLTGSDRARTVHDRYVHLVADQLGVRVVELGDSFPAVGLDEWLPKADGLVGVVGHLIREFPEE
ncbi:MAG: hypothetical protein WA208_18500 [Thermoanaerobaculia bacterium]